MGAREEEEAAEDDNDDDGNDNNNGMCFVSTEFVIASSLAAFIGHGGGDSDDQFQKARIRFEFSTASTVILRNLNNNNIK